MTSLAQGVAVVGALVLLPDVGEDVPAEAAAEAGHAAGGAPRGRGRRGGGCAAVPQPQRRAGRRGQRARRGADGAAPPHGEAGGGGGAGGAVEAVARHAVHADVLVVVGHAALQLANLLQRLQAAGVGDLEAHMACKGLRCFLPHSFRVQFPLDE